MLVVVQFQRPFNKSYYSLERIFATLRSVTTSCKIILHVCPCDSRGIVKRLWNMFDAVMTQGDVNHITGDVHYLALALRGRRTLLTVHDCSGMQSGSALKRWLYRWIWLKLPVWRSRLVTVVSEQTKQDLMRYTSCCEGKIRVIPNPVGAGFRESPRDFPASPPTILQIGTSANKNVDRLIAALSGIECKLEIVGPTSGPVIHALNNSGIAYRCSASLTDSELVAKYVNADVVTFCSIYEGFGMPIIEAQAVGRPVVTSNIEPMKSVCGGAACLVDPYDVGSIRDGVNRVIHDSAYRKALIAEGLVNVKRFRPDAIAESYCSLYRELAGDVIAGR